MRRRLTLSLIAALALAFPAVLLPPATGAEAAATFSLVDQTSGAATPTADSSSPNFSPSNYFGPGSLDNTADDFTVPTGATWAISEIDVTGAFSGATTDSAVNVFIYADTAGKPGAELFSQLAAPTTGAPNFQVPLTAVPPLAAGHYWVSVQFVAGAGPVYWSWGTNTVQRGSAASWRSTASSMSCAAGTWSARTTCWGGTNPDQVFVLKGTNTASNTITLGKVTRHPKAGTATLKVSVPGPGTLDLAGKGVARKQREVTHGGSVGLSIKPRGAAKRKLNRTGRATVTVAVTFTPPAGVSRTVTKKVKLRKDLA